MSTDAACARSWLPEANPHLRLPIAVFLSRFPLITETFILREVIELERQGQPVRLIPLLKESPDVIHDEARSWIDRAEYTPFLSWGIVASNLRLLRRRPLGYVSLLARVLLGSWKSANLLIGTLGIFPKSVYLAERLAADGVSHLHAHYATHPAMAVKIISHLTGLPYSVTTHAHDIFVHQAMLQEKIRDASFVRVISRFNRDFLRRLDPSIPREKLPLIRVGIQAGRRAPIDTPVLVLQPHILCVASFKPYKGLNVLVKACALLREEGWDLVCDLVGDGPLRRAVADQVARYGLQDVVHLHGPLGQHEVAKLIGRSSLFVLPSVVAKDGQMEGIPVALMEAMALGRPVIASRLSGIPELVEDGRTGLLVEPGDVRALVEALKRLIRDPRLARRLGRAARKKVLRRHNLERSVANLLGLMDRYRSAFDSEAAQRIRNSSYPEYRGVNLGLRWERDRRDSWIAGILMSSSSGTREVVIKRHKTREGQSCAPAVRARREYEILSRLRHQFVHDTAARAQGPRLAVPRVLHLDEQESTLVMEHCAGIPLEGLLAALRRDWDAGLAETSQHLCGEWLGRFQCHNQVAGNAFRRIEDLMHQALEHLTACRRALVLSVTSDEIRREFDTHGSCLASSSLKLCGVHGDFWPGNIFIGKDRVEVIDFEGYSEGLSFEDVGCFLVHLELSFGYPFLRRRVAVLERAFLKGYLNGERIDPAALRLGRIATALRILANMRSRDRRHGWLRGWRIAFLDKTLRGRSRR